MLEIKNIKKSYKTGSFVQHALDGIDLKFRKNEFVAILGPSGSGKTTLLNIIGGLDRYDSGDLLIKGKSTKKFKDRDWDAYRNKSIGFVFQSYNLITHISILNNIEMAMTLSGKKASMRKKKAKELLKEVGLVEHAHKKPNQLSGGQMQRVAIARALANDPEIILADEPTGALDTKTSEQIMKLIQKISKDKLVIMVTHNPELANKYADRVINMQDGKIIKDSKSYKEEKDGEEYKLKKTKMSFFTALYLSLNNIRTKKGRTLITAFASSIGIIGIALILALSNGFQKQIDIFEHQISDAMPVVIMSTKSGLNAENVSSIIASESGMKKEDSENDFTDSNKVSIKTNENDSLGLAINPITTEFMDYINNIDSNYVSAILVRNSIEKKLIQKYKDAYINSEALMVTKTPLPDPCGDNSETFIDNYYDVLVGKMPTEVDEIVIEVGRDNTISEETAKILGIDKEDITFDDIMNSTIKLVHNDDYYTQRGNYFQAKIVDEDLYNNENNLELKVVGILRIKKEKYSTIGITDSNNAIYYSSKLENYIKDSASKSKIALKQKEVNYSVRDGRVFDVNNALGKYYLQQERMAVGALNTPYNIQIYPTDFDATDKIIEYLNKYNEGKSEEEQIEFINQAELINNTTSSIMSGITTVLIAFSAISLVVSSIMLGIITYISVLERTKEIGILRALGARKKDIKRVFNAETIIIGFTSGLIGILIANVLTIPINSYIYKLTTLKNVAILNPIHAVILIIISMILTLIGGAIPAHIASKQDVVTSLRTE